MGHDPYREEARRLLGMLVVGAAFVVGLVLHVLISPHLEALPALAIAVAGGLAAEVLLVLLLRRRRSSRSAESDRRDGRPRRRRAA